MNKFLTADGCSLLEIHRRLRSVYGVVTIDVGSVRCWARRFKNGEKDIGYRPRSKRPATVANFGRVKFFGRGATINSELSLQILKNLEPIRRVRPNMKMNQFPSCMTTPDCARGRQLRQWCVLSPSSSLQSRFSTFLDPCVN